MLTRRILTTSAACAAVLMLSPASPAAANVAVGEPVTGTQALQPLTATAVATVTRQADGSRAVTFECVAGSAGRDVVRTRIDCSLAINGVNFDNQTRTLSGAGSVTAQARLDVPAAGTLKICYRGTAEYLTSDPQSTPIGCVGLVSVA